MISVDVHDTVGTGIVVATNTILLNIFPRRLFHGNIVELEPTVVKRTVDVCPIVA